MREIFWLKPQIAGRAGPDLAPWDPSELAAAGITRILSVNNANSVYREDLQRAGIEHHWLPLSDNAPPRDGDFELCIETLPRCLQLLDQTIASSGIALIHCRSGKDRTGLVMCHYLCQRESMQPQAAVRELRRLRPIGLSAPGYESFTLDVLRYLLKGG